LDKGDKEVSADDADARDGAQVLNFREGSASLKEETPGLVLSLECLVHQFIEQAGFERPADREAVAGANVGG
jgi:hypothetical protein